MAMMIAGGKERTQSVLQGPDTLQRELCRGKLFGRECSRIMLVKIMLRIVLLARRQRCR